MLALFRNDVREIVVLGVVTILLVWIATRPGAARRALALMVSRPAFLVPAAMSMALAAFLTFGPHELRVTGENPFGSELYGEWASARWGLWALVVCVLHGVLVAGQIGLLEAHHTGRPIDSDAFGAGVRQHWRTIVLARLLTFGVACTIAGTIAPTEGWMVLYVLPSLFFAPIPGLASAYPGRTLFVIARSLRHSYVNLRSVGLCVLAQAAVLVGMTQLVSRWVAIDPHHAVLNTTTLGYNIYPLIGAPGPGFFVTMATVVATFTSSVFITAHWIGATQGYAAPRREPSPATDLA